MLFLGLGALALTLLFYSLKPETPAQTATATALPAAAAPAAAPVYELEIRKGLKVAGPDVIRIGQGSPLTLKILSDHADELHMHGYDLHATLKPGVPSVLNFKADHSGRFTMELHHSNVELGTLEVQPR